MGDLTLGYSPQRTMIEEGNAEIIMQILTELKKINTQLMFITDNVVKDEDIIEDKEDV